MTFKTVAFWVGLAAGLQGLGLVGFGMFGGVLVDRLERRRLLMSVQVISGTLALTVGLLVVMDQIALWHILVVAILQGVLQGVQLPAGHALTYQAVGPNRLLNAMAARMLGFNVMRIVGSLIAGALISLARIHRRRASGQCPEAARGCSLFWGRLCCFKTIIPDSQEHPIDATTQPSRSHPNRV